MKTPRQRNRYRQSEPYNVVAKTYDNFREGSSVRMRMKQFTQAVKDDGERFVAPLSAVSRFIGNGQPADIRPYLKEFGWRFVPISREIVL